MFKNFTDKKDNVEIMYAISHTKLMVIVSIAIAIVFGLILSVGYLLVDNTKAYEQIYESELVIDSQEQRIVQMSNHQNDRSNRNYNPTDEETHTSDNVEVVEETTDISDDNVVSKYFSDTFGIDTVEHSVTTFITNLH